MQIFELVHTATDKHDPILSKGWKWLKFRASKWDSSCVSTSGHTCSEFFKHLYYIVHLLHAKFWGSQSCCWFAMTCQWLKPIKSGSWKLTFCVGHFKHYLWYKHLVCIIKVLSTKLEGNPLRIDWATTNRSFIDLKWQIRTWAGHVKNTIMYYELISQWLS